MDALWNFGSLRRSSATLAAAEQPPPPPPPHPEFAENAVTTTSPQVTAPQVEDQVSGNQVPESMEEEQSSNGDALLDGREPTEDQVQLAEEEEEERLTPIRAPVSRDDDDDDDDDEDDDDDDDDDEEVGDGDVSFGSGESFDSALERMAASSTGSFDASPAGSLVGGASHLDNQQQRKKGLGVGQQGALMRLNQMISGESTLDTAVLEDCTEEEFKDKIQEIARSRELSPTDASISSILEALLPLVRAGGGAQGTASQEMEIKVGDNEEEEEEMTGNNEDELLSKNNRPVEGEGGIVQAEQDQDVADDEEGIVNQEDDEAKEDLDISASVMPVAKLSADDDELIEAEDELNQGEQSNDDEFEEAYEKGDEEDDEATLGYTMKENVKETSPRIIARESKDDDTEEVLTANPANNEDKQVQFHADAALPEELGSISIGNKEPIPQEVTQEIKGDGGDIEDKTEVPSISQEERAERKGTDLNVDAVADKDGTGELSVEETSPLVVSEPGLAHPKGDGDVAAAPEESSNSEAIELDEEAIEPSPAPEDKSESGLGEEDGTPTIPEVLSEEADGLQAVDNRAASESAIISEEPRREVKIENESSLSGVPQQVSSNTVADFESGETNAPVDLVSDEDVSERQTLDFPVATTEDFIKEEDRDSKATEATATAESDTTVEATDVDVSLPDTVKSVEPVTETREHTETEAEAESELATQRESQAGNGNWDEEDDDEEEENDDEDDDDEEEEEEEDGPGNLDAAKALAALVKSASSRTDSAGRNANPPSLGAAGPSLPQRPTGRTRSATALEPASRNPPRSNVATASQLAAPAEDNSSNGDGNDGNDETREKLQNIRVKFLRLAHRLGQSPQNVVVAQVLYRLGLAEQLRGGGSASRTGAFSFDRANAIAEEQEASGQEEELDFACTVLLLGKTGVGKSATINSIFDEPRTSTNAFHPSTKKVQEIVGNVHGIKVRVIDTPGLLPSVLDQQHNERIMGSVKQFIRKSSPDIVLYFDRLDMQSRDYGDLPLLRTITDLFGAAVWFNAIVVLTHASSAPPDGPNGVPLSYEMFVAQRSHVVQQTIRQAAGDMRLMNPVSLVENHPACRTNRAGQRVLPNGQIWKPQLLLLCFASKILAEANSLLKLQDTGTPGRPFGQRQRVPPLPFLLSSLLQSRAQLKVPDEQMGDEDDTDEDDDDEDSDGDDYDELPPFRPLSKEELEELSKEQKQQYAEELADRERLFQKKQWREELRRRKEMKQRAAAMSKEELAEGVDEDGGRAAAVPVPMPDMALPPSFDSDNPTHRYRYLETANQWLVRPVLETHGWDHDAGYDGFNVEKLFVVADKIPASISGQVTKDKKEGQVNFEAAASFKHGEGKSTLAGFDIQTVGKDLGYTLRSETQFDNFKRNKTTAGLTFTLLGDTIAAGLKLEDRLLVGKRFKMIVNGGVLTGRGDKAFGGSLEATLRGKEYPLSHTLSTLGLSVMDWHGDLAIGGNLQSQFMVGKTMMVARANLNNRGAGQISIRASSSEQLQMVLIGIIPILRSLINSQFGTAQPSQ